MSRSHNLIESLAQDRDAERYRAVRRPQEPAGTAAHGGRAVETTRRRAGWLLVGLGLRLITGHGGAAAQRVTLIGQ